MSRFTYGSNGRSNRDTDLSLLEELLGETPTTGSAQPMEVSANPFGTAAQIEKYYVTLARGVISLMGMDQLNHRQLASGVYVYTSERSVKLEPGREAVAAPDDLIAVNFNDFFNPPTGEGTPEKPATMWVAQSLIDYDFGVQHQERARHSL